MSINDQIEAAAKERAAIAESWETYEAIRDPAEEPLETFGNGFRAGAEWGRREAAKGLWIDAPVWNGKGPSYMDCWAKIEGKWYPGEYWREADEVDFKSSVGLPHQTYARHSCESIVIASTIPSPSELFEKEESQ